MANAQAFEAQPRRRMALALLATTALATLLGGCMQTGLPFARSGEEPKLSATDAIGAIAQWSAAYAQNPQDPKLVLGYAAALTLLTVVLVAASVGGCFTSPRFQSPFTLANPNERHPIAVRRGEVTLDLAVYPGASGLNGSQKAKVVNFLAQSSDRPLIRAPSGGPNEAAAMRAYDQVRKALRHAGIDPRSVALEPYFGNGDPSAPVRLSYLQFVAEAPDCPDWSENVGRDPQNMPWPDMGCATQRNLAAMVANPEDLVRPRGETQRSGERLDAVWGKYVQGQPTISKRDPSEHANASEVSPIGGGQ